MADGFRRNTGETISMEGIDVVKVTSYGSENRKADCVFLAQHDGGPEQLIPRINGSLIDAPEVVDEYMEVNRDVGSAELAHVSAMEAVRISNDLRVLVVEALVPREIIDPNRIKEYAVRNVLNPEGSQEAVGLLLRIHEKIVTVMNELLYGLLKNKGIFVDIHTMSPFSPENYLDEEAGRLTEFIDLWTNPARQKSGRRSLDLITEIPGERLIADPVLVRNFSAALEANNVDKKYNDPYPRQGYPTRRVLGTLRMIDIPGIAIDVPKDYLSVAGVADPEWHLGKLKLSSEKVGFLAKILAKASVQSLREIRS